MNVRDVMLVMQQEPVPQSGCVYSCGSSHCRQVAPGRYSCWPGTHPGLSWPPPATFALMSPPPPATPCQLLLSQVFPKVCCMIKQMQLRQGKTFHCLWWWYLLWHGTTDVNCCWWGCYDDIGVSDGPDDSGDTDGDHSGSWEQDGRHITSHNVPSGLI